MKDPTAPDEREAASHQAATRWPLVSDGARDEINELLSAGRLSLDVERFERMEADLGQLFDVRHALLTCNGTAAGFSAIHAIGLGPGDEIVAPAYTHWATALPALHLGCRITFADTCSDSLGIHVDSVERVVTPATKAVVACHLYGNPVDLEALQEFCQRRGLFLIEDISHAPGATVAGRPVGSFGDVAFCSMQAAKLLAGGEAGFLLTNDAHLYRRAVELAHPKRIGRLVPDSAYQGVGLGLKFRPSVLHVALAHHALKQLEGANRVRREMYRLFRQSLGCAAGVDFPWVAPNASRVYWEYEMMLRPEANLAEVVRTMRQQGYVLGPAKLELLPDLPHFSAGPANPDGYSNARRLRGRLLVIRAFSRPASSVARALGRDLGEALEKFGD